MKKKSNMDATQQAPAEKAPQPEQVITTEKAEQKLDPHPSMNEEYQEVSVVTRCGFTSHYVSFLNLAVSLSKTLVNLQILKLLSANS